MLHFQPLVFNPLPKNPDLMTASKNPFENIAGKGENAGNHHFLLFQKSFQLYPSQKSVF